MKKIFLLLLLIAGFVGCQPMDVSSDLSARVEGRYSVQYYVVNGDTLFSINGKNKLGVGNFYIKVERTKADMVKLKTLYTKSGASIETQKDARVEEVANELKLSAIIYEPSIYECTVKDGVFYERRVGPNIDSLKDNNSTLLEEIIISARK